MYAYTRNKQSTMRSNFLLIVVETFYRSVAGFSRFYYDPYDKSDRRSRQISVSLVVLFITKTSDFEFGVTLNKIFIELFPEFQITILFLPLS